MTTAPAVSAFAALSSPPKACSPKGSPLADILLDLRNWSWLQSLLATTFVLFWESLSLVCVVKRCFCVQVLSVAELMHLLWALLSTLSKLDCNVCMQAAQLLFTYACLTAV